jgi:signal transduction histidine kinase
MNQSSSTIVNPTAQFELVSRLLAAGGGSSTSIEAILGDIAGTFDLGEVGIRWPAMGQVQIQETIGNQPTPRWDSAVTGRVAGARSATEAFADLSAPSRLIVPLIVDGARNGIFWATSREDDADDNREALVVVGQCLARHPAVRDRIGVGHDVARIAQRLGDASIVAAKIAHDFDNIFTGVVGFGEMALSMLDPESPPHQFLREIVAAGTRGTKFTQQLHQLSRSGQARPVPTGIAGILKREENRLQKQADFNKRVDFRVAADLPPVAMDCAAIQVVVGHLLDNSVDASPADGVIRVEATLVELSESEAREFIGNAAAGPYVKVTVANDGPVILDEHRKRLFVEPFFTTKVRHRGLGLSVVFRIVHAHGGGVRYVSAPAGVSAFQIVLPLAAARTEAGVGPEITRIPRGPAS